MGTTTSALSLRHTVTALRGPAEADLLYDLGCGDGRIVVTAAKKYGLSPATVVTSSRRREPARILVSRWDGRRWAPPVSARLGREDLAL
jgi:hypothetical protein